MIDVETLTWARLDKTIKEPDAKVLASGQLLPQGWNVYTMGGRTADSLAPGAGLCSFGISLIPLGRRITIKFKVNKEAGEIKDLSLPLPPNEITWEVLK
jgi:hypothetical protein